MQFWNDNNDDEGRESNRRPPQPPPNWRKWVSPGLLVLVLLLMLISSPGLLGGISSTPEIAYSDVYEQVQRNNVDALQFQDNVSVSGKFRSGVIVTSATGRSQSISSFTAQLPPYAGAELLDLARQGGVDTIRGDWTQTSPWLGLILNFLPLVLNHRLLCMDGAARAGADEWHLFFWAIPGAGENAGNAIHQV